MSGIHYNTGLGDDILGRITKAQATKAKIDKIGLKTQTLYGKGNNKGRKKIYELEENIC